MDETTFPPLLVSLLHNSGAKWTPCCCTIITRSCSMRMFLSIWWLFFSVTDISYFSGELHCLQSLQGGNGAAVRELCRNERNVTLKKDEGEEDCTSVATYTVRNNTVTRSYTKCYTCNMHVTCTGQEKTWYIILQSFISHVTCMDLGRTFISTLIP